MATVAFDKQALARRLERRHGEARFAGLPG
jgi:hypothetical protein